MGSRHERASSRYKFAGFSVLGNQGHYLLLGNFDIIWEAEGVLVEIERKVAALMVVVLVVLGLVAGIFLTQFMQARSNDGPEERFVRPSVDYEQNGTYEVTRSVIVTSTNSTLKFYVDESWEEVKWFFYPLYTRTIWSCNYTVSSANNAIFSSGIGPESSGDYAGGASVPAFQTQGGYGNWTLTYQITGGPVVVEITKINDRNGQMLQG
jgi:hypothetical protein